MKKGKFIVLEGLDGSGKTSVIDRLKIDFPNFIYTKEPGGSEFGEMIRNILLNPKSKNVPPLPMILGFMSSRASHIEELIIPALKKGNNVICDRFDASTFAFQLFGQNSRKLEDVFWFLRKRMLRQISVKYIYLRITPEVAELRRRERSLNNHFDRQTDEYHKRVFSGYDMFFTKNRSYKVDASMDKNSVYKKVLSILKKMI